MPEETSVIDDVRKSVIDRVVVSIDRDRDRPLARSSLACGRDFQVIDDGPILIVKRPDDLAAQLFAIDTETATFMKEQLKDRPARSPLPPDYEHLCKLGLLKEINRPKQRPPSLYNPAAPTWDDSVAANDLEGIQARFDRDGFVKIKSFRSKDEILTIRENLQRYQQDVAPSCEPFDRMAIETNDGSRCYSLLGRIDHYDPYFHDLLHEPQLNEIAQKLLRGAIGVSHIQFFNIIPGRGAPTPPHQDSFNFLLEEGKMLNCWLPLVPISEQNGRLHYVVGSHREGHRPHSLEAGRSPTVSDYSDKDRAREVAVDMEPGDLLIHHGVTIHGSCQNRSPAERWALGFPFVLGSERRTTREDWLAGAAGL